MTRDDVMRMVQEHNVRFIRMWFTDVIGVLKSFSITVQELETALDEGIGFDGSSVEGFSRIEESDMIAMPDPSTFAILPWRSMEEGSVARVICDVQNPDGTEYVGCPRGVLRRNLQKAANLGYTMYAGPELEYFYFKNDKGTEVLDKGGYFDLTPLDVASNMRRDTVLALEKLGIPVECSHHEVAPSQHEIAIRHADALRMADNAMTYRLTVKEVAMQHGIYATFMPKPIFGENGSGMHVHQSLFKGSENAMFSPDDEYSLSATGKSYIAGLLKYAPEMCCVLAQSVNSYKRLVPGYEAPVYVAWARRNRSALVRVPMYKPGKEKATRCELRCADPACNPYLAFSVMLAAGLKGIQEGYTLCDPIEEDIFEMSPSERIDAGITSLPGSLGEAIALSEKSAFLRETLGDHVFDKFIANKKIEWDKYRIHVSQFELDTYLPNL
jgi:glutamine synthetase